MSLQLFRRIRWLLPLLAGFIFGLVAPQALADRDNRGHGRHYYQHDKHHKHYKHYKHYKKHQHRHSHYRHAPRRVRVVEQHYYYPEPSHYYYREHHSSGPSISVTLPLGTIVRGLPGGYVSFHLGGDPYYYHGGNYYRPYYRSYQVVSPPPGHRW